MTKAQLSISFNWLFVLIIGVIIIAFFFTVIKAQQHDAAAEEASRLVLTLDTVFSTITNNPDTVQEFPIMNAKLEFVCDEDISQYYIQGAGPESTTNDLLFTPAMLEGNKILTWTKEWQVPFEAGIFTYIANDKTLFIFVRDIDDGYIERLSDGLPSIFKKAIVEDEESIQLLSGNDRYVIITTGEYTITNKKVVVRKIDFANNKITFIPNNEERDYVMNETLWGAIFTEDKQTFDCTMEKAMMKMSKNAAILEQRTILIQDTERLNTVCNTFFTDAKTAFSDMKRLTSYADSYTAIKTNEESLRKNQAIMQRGGQCPLIY